MHIFVSLFLLDSLSASLSLSLPMNLLLFRSISNRHFSQTLGPVVVVKRDLHTGVDTELYVLSLAESLGIS